MSARVNPFAINQSIKNTESSANNLGSWMESLSTADIKNLQANDSYLKPIIDLKTEYDEKPSRSVLLSSNPKTKILLHFISYVGNFGNERQNIVTGKFKYYW